MSVPFWDNAIAVIGPGTEGADYMANPWDTARMQGARLPGLVVVEIPELERRLQAKKQNGGDGETPTFRGLNCAKVEVDVIMWRPNHFIIWQQIAPILFPLAGGDPAQLVALDFQHPAAAEIGVTAVVIRKRTGLLPGPVHGSKRVHLSCEQFKLPPAKKTSTKSPKGAVAITDGFKPAATTKNAGAQPPSVTDAWALPPTAAQQGSS